MVLKISRGVWFVSTLATLASLLVIYASLPERVFLVQDGLEYVSLDREAFFYVALGLITLVNALVYVVRSLFEKEEGFRAWFHLLIVSVNVFFIVTLFFLSAYNTTERFNFQRVGFVVYGSVALVALCALFWPVYSLFRKKSSKQAI